MESLLTMIVAGVMLLGTAHLQERNVSTTDVAPVWAGHPVAFSLLTNDQTQYVAFYDADRRMTVAQRTLDSAEWTFQVLPERVGWDSHNYLTMALDAEGHLHVSGNMHNHPLVYFRTEEAGDVTSLQRHDAMTGEQEGRVTYPRFLRDADDRLIYYYRDGGSGDGQWVFNVYDEASQQWSRLLEQPLLARVGRGGEGTLNAYPRPPTLGPDGFFHLVWCWRDTPDAATNHDVSYARSRDLVHWETSDGTPLELPITIDTAEVIDPVPAGGGMINSNLALGFDPEGRPVVSYHKFDEDGHTQLINARLEEGEWVRHQASDWSYRWEFGGGGSLGKEIGVGPVRVLEDGRIVQNVSHAREPSGTWRLDPETLELVERVRLENPVPPELRRPASDFEGMRVKWAGDSGTPPSGRAYRLRWETLGPNRDRPREGPLPPPSTLQVIELPSGAEREKGE